MLTCRVERPALLTVTATSTDRTPLVYFGVPNDRRKKATIKWLVFNVWISAVLVVSHDAIHAPTFHAQK